MPTNTVENLRGKLGDFNVFSNPDDLLWSVGVLFLGFKIVNSPGIGIFNLYFIVIMDCFDSVFVEVLINLFPMNIRLVLLFTVIGNRF